MGFYFDNSFQPPPPNQYNLGNFSEQFTPPTHSQILPPGALNLGDYASQLQMPEGHGNGSKLAQYLAGGLGGAAKAAMMGLMDDEGGDSGPHKKLSQNVPNKHWQLSKWLASFL